jgi:hypothetical protein
MKLESFHFAEEKRYKPGDLVADPHGLCFIIAVFNMKNDLRDAKGRPVTFMMAVSLKTGEETT